MINVGHVKALNGPMGVVIQAPMIRGAAGLLPFFVFFFFFFWLRLLTKLIV